MSIDNRVGFNLQRTMAEVWRFGSLVVLLDVFVSQSQSKIVSLERNF